MYKLNIKILQDELVNIDRYYDNKPNLVGDAGMDLAFPIQTIVQSEETALIPLGVSAEMIRIRNGFVKPVSYFIVPRSSIYKTPLRMSNSIGVIDSGYRGELMVPVDNDTDDDYMITPGERLFQIILPSLEEFEIQIVDKLSDSTRGSGGFGSTGKWQQLDIVNYQLF
mgnify:FL=1